MNNKDRTFIGFIIFVIFLVLGLVLAKENEEIESDDKD